MKNNILFILIITQLFTGVSCFRNKEFEIRTYENSGYVSPLDYCYYKLLYHNAEFAMMHIEFYPDSTFCAETCSRIYMGTFTCKKDTIKLNPTSNPGNIYPLEFLNKKNKLVGIKRSPKYTFIWQVEKIM